jgi:hypothetical protein
MVYVLTLVEKVTGLMAEDTEDALLAIGKA